MPPRLRRRRIAAILAIVALTAGLLAIGDPLSHPGEGAQEDGRRGLAEIPRIVWFSALAIAFLLAWPDRAKEEGGEP